MAIFNGYVSHYQRVTVSWATTAGITGSGTTGTAKAHTQQRSQGRLQRRKERWRVVCKRDILRGGPTVTGDETATVLAIYGL